MIKQLTTEDKVYDILSKHLIDSGDSNIYDAQTFAAVDMFLSEKFRRGMNYQYEVSMGPTDEDGYASVSWCENDRSYMINWKFQ